MKIRKMDHVGIVVNDLPAAKAFFLDLGLELQGEGEAEGVWLDAIVGLNGVRTAFAMLRTPEGQMGIELIRYYSPTDVNGVQQATSNTLGIRHVALVVDDIESVVTRLKEKGTEIFSEIHHFEGGYMLCYVRGPEGIILELAQELQ